MNYSSLLLYTCPQKRKAQSCRNCPCFLQQPPRIIRKKWTWKRDRRSRKKEESQAETDAAAGTYFLFFPCTKTTMKDLLDKGTVQTPALLFYLQHGICPASTGQLNAPDLELLRQATQNKHEGIT